MPSAERPSLPSLHATEVPGTGPLVVFLHGLFGQGKNFSGIAKALSPDFRSLLVDLPDHGLSGWTERLDYTVMADAVAALVRERAGDGPVHVVGHSMGGKTAMQLALRHPDLVDRLVVVDVSPVETAGTGEFAHLLDTLAGLDLATIETRGDADAALAGPIPDPTVRGFLLQNLRKDDTGAWVWRANLAMLRRELPAISGFPAGDEAPFNHPVLWVAGERSDYVTPERIPAMRALFPRARLLTVKGAGHWVHSERPDVVVEALRAFLG
ncbi:alpha/beta fold hydrolase [Cellulomonas sp. P22]|uniref:alpha/beta fold hydrolase n=1 Tax=Cellulomonas sp. P22 TaxID=3373189 RepID=UPI0037A605E5